MTNDLTSNSALKPASTIGETLTRATAALMGRAGTPRTDAQLILGHVIDKPREYLIAHSEQPLADRDVQVFDKLLTLRTKGMPLAYILGRRAFFDRSFLVTPHVLIPRPETEHIVEAALDWAHAEYTARRTTHPASGRALRIVDVGTGSGAIAVTVAAHVADMPGTLVIATDISAAALVVARENAEGLTNLHYAQGDLLLPLRGPLDVICANLPYIATGDVPLLEVAKFEPHVALDGGYDGLCLIRRLLDQAPTRLARPGLMLLEIACDQRDAVIDLARAAFPDASVSIIKDYAKLDRVARIELLS